MSNEPQLAITSNEGEIVLYQPDESIKLEVTIDKETVWLSQAQICELFQKAKSTISYHIHNIFKEKELDEKVVVRKFRTTTQHGAIPGKTQDNELFLYNLDVIISVGYRVKCQRGTQFRIWATNVLRQYLLKGYAIHCQMQQLEQRIDNRFIVLQEYTNEHVSRLQQQLDQQQQQLDFFIRTNLPPIEGIFYEGQVLDARAFAEQLIKSAQHEVLLIDNYIDARTFEILETRNQNVICAIHVEHIGKGLRTLQQTSQFQTGRLIELCETSQRMHDRFLIIDDMVYHLGASLNELGKRLFAFSKMCISKSMLV